MTGYKVLMLMRFHILRLSLTYINIKLDIHLTLIQISEDHMLRTSPIRILIDPLVCSDNGLVLLQRM